MKRFFVLFYFLSIVSMFLISYAYEFWIEGGISFSFLSAHGIAPSKETTADNWKYIFTVTIFSAIALLLPIILMYKIDLKRRRIEAEKLKVQAQLDKTLTKLLSGFVSICCECKKVRVKDEEKKSEGWANIAEYITERTDLMFSHGYCPDCAAKLKQDIKDLHKKNSH